MTFEQAHQQITARGFAVWHLNQRTDGRGWKAHLYRVGHPGGAAMRDGRPGFLLDKAGEGRTAAEALLVAAGMWEAPAAVEEDEGIFG